MKQKLTGKVPWNSAVKELTQQLMVNTLIWHLQPMVSIPYLIHLGIPHTLHRKYYYIIVTSIEFMDHPPLFNWHTVHSIWDDTLV